LVDMGDKLRSLRMEKKLTQKQIAERIGLAISAVSSYESNNRYPSYEVLIKLARIFHVSTDYLLGITNKRNIDVTGLDEEEIELLSLIADKFRRNH
jgi:transcriptional regulator with XRE-family HTH domain